MGDPVKPGTMQLLLTGSTHRRDIHTKRYGRALNDYSYTFAELIPRKIRERMTGVYSGVVLLGFLSQATIHLIRG